MTVLAVPVRPEEDATLRPVPWRRMGWVTWRQHRSALTGVATLLSVIAAWLWIAGVHLHHAYATAIACHPATSLACSSLINRFNGTGGFLTNGLLLQPVPALIGAFVGAPILARDLETGTFRFTWTQGFGRLRWALAKVVALGLAVTAAAAAMSVVFFWYYQPYFPTRNQSLSLSEWSPFAPGLFDLRGVVFAAWTLAAFAIGALAGTLLRRVVPAIVATLATYTGLALLVGGFLRQRYLTALVTTKAVLPGSAWITGYRWTKGGLPVSQSMVIHVLEEAPGSVAGKGGIPKSFGTVQYLAQHGYTQWTTYQPSARFWPLQWIEGGGLLTLSLLLIAVTYLVIRRRAA